LIERKTFIQFHIGMEFLFVLLSLPIAFPHHFELIPCIFDIFQYPERRSVYLTMGNTFLLVVQLALQRMHMVVLIALLA
jgi:hypothetical protein